MCFDALCDFIRVSHFRITNNLELAAIVRGQEWLETEAHAWLRKSAET